MISPAWILRNISLHFFIMVATANLNTINAQEVKHSLEESNQAIEDILESSSKAYFNGGAKQFAKTFKKIANTKIAIIGGGVNGVESKESIINELQKIEKRFGNLLYVTNYGYAKLLVYEKGFIKYYLRIWGRTQQTENQLTNYFSLICKFNEKLPWNKETYKLIVGTWEKKRKLTDSSPFSFYADGTYISHERDDKDWMRIGEWHKAYQNIIQVLSKKLVSQSGTKADTGGFVFLISEISDTSFKTCSPHNGITEYIKIKMIPKRVTFTPLDK